jgi:hypothetical protein
MCDLHLEARDRKLGTRHAGLSWYTYLWSFVKLYLADQKLRSGQTISVTYVHTYVQTDVTEPNTIALPFGAGANNCLLVFSCKNAWSILTDTGTFDTMYWSNPKKLYFIYISVLTDTQPYYKYKSVTDGRTDGPKLIYNSPPHCAKRGTITSTPLL